MAETNTARFGLRQWGDPSDTPSRSEFNASFLQIENLGAIDVQGTRAARPVASVRGRYYYATDTKITYRDDGSSWSVVGGVLESLSVVAPSASTVVGTFKAAASQTADILNLTDSNNALLSSFSSKGAFVTNGVYLTGNTNESSSGRINSAVANFSALSATTPAVAVKGFDSQSANLLEVRNSSSTLLARYSAAGEHYAPKSFKNSDTDAAANNEFVTLGHLIRNITDYKIVPLTQTAYNALATKDSKTVYLITG